MIKNSVLLFNRKRGRKFLYNFAFLIITKIYVIQESRLLFNQLTDIIGIDFSDNLCAAVIGRVNAVGGNLLPILMADMRCKHLYMTRKQKISEKSIDTLEIVL